MSNTTLYELPSRLSDMESTLAFLRMSEHANGMKYSESPAAKLLSMPASDAQTTVGCPGLSASSSASSETLTENDTPPNSPNSGALVPLLQATVELAEQMSDALNRAKQTIDMDVATPKPVLRESKSYLSQYVQVKDKDTGYETEEDRGGKILTKDCSDSDSDDLIMKQPTGSQSTIGSRPRLERNHTRSTDEGKARIVYSGSSSTASVATVKGSTTRVRIQRPTRIDMPSSSSMDVKPSTVTQQQIIGLGISFPSTTYDAPAQSTTGPIRTVSKTPEEPLPTSYKLRDTDPLLDPRSPTSSDFRRVALAPVVCLDTPSPIDDLPSPVRFIDWKGTRKTKAHSQSGGRVIVSIASVLGLRTSYSALAQEEPVDDSDGGMDTDSSSKTFINPYFAGATKADK